MLWAVAAFAQTDTGQITGTVRDTTGAVVSGAKVTATSITTATVRSGVSNSTGNYTIAALKPDTYDVTIEAQGFKKVTRRVQVAVSSTNEVSVEMAVGGAATTVEVTGSNEGATVDTENATMSSVIGSHEIAELPTLTRNPYDLVGTSGNVNEDTNSGRGAGYSINGMRSSSTDILLDGGQNVDTFSATVGQVIPLDSVQEFSVLTNNFGAEYGRASGGVVNLVTKSGTNAFHGSAYEYNRVSALSSNTYQNGATDTPKGVFTRNDFGFSIGGPIIKDKLFFFSNTEWLRVRSSAPTQYTIVDPTSYAALAPASQAYFSAYGHLAPGVTPISTTPCGVATPITCETVSFLAPSDAGGGAPQNTWMEVARVDYNLSDKTTMFARYASYKELDFPGYVNSSPYAGYNTGDSNYDQNVTFNLTHVFSPTLVNTIKLDYNRLNGPVDTLGTAPVSPTLYTSSSGTGSINGVPLIFPGYSETSPGSAIPFGGPQNLYQIYDDLSWTKGKHSFKFGGQYIQIRDNRLFGAYENAVEGLNGAVDPNAAIDQLVAGNIYQFEGASYPQGKYPCVRNINTGAYMVTPACTLTLPVGEPDFSRNNRYNDFALYGQDSWKLSPRLTVNAGLRWEYFGVQHNANPNLDSNFYLGSGSNIFDQIRNGTVQIADQSPTGGLWGKNYGNFGPRLGFAWDIFGDGKTSLRGGYGISYERNFGNVTFNVIQNPPNYAVVSLISGQDVPGNLPVFTDNAGPLAGTGTKPLPSTSLRAVDQNIATAYAETWNFGIQRQLTAQNVLTIEYAGSHGVHLYDIANINPAGGGNPDGCGSGGTYLGDSRCENRLNLQYSNINYRGDQGYSHYDAMNVTLNSTNWANKGLNLTMNYTWSHSLDNLSSTFSEIYGGLSGDYYLGYIDPFNPKLDYGNSDFDVRQRFVIGATWDLPWMKNSSNGILRNVLGGWGTGSIIKIRSGAPYSVYDCSNFNGTSCPLYDGSFLMSPTGGNQGVAGPNLFNYSAIPGNGSSPLNGNGVPVTLLGDALGLPTCTGLYHTGCSYTQTPGVAYPERNQFYGPGYWNIDMNFYKNFKLTERFNLQFRGELYNIFNHSNLYILSQNLDVSSVGSGFIQAERGGIYGYAGQPTDERRNIQFALRLQF
jgi:outer membrane receptor protein involved in Fe transport